MVCPTALLQTPAGPGAGSIARRRLSRLFGAALLLFLLGRGMLLPAADLAISGIDLGPDGRPRLGIAAPPAGMDFIDVLGLTNTVSSPWQLRQILTPTNGAATWTDTNSAGVPSQWYRLRSDPAPGTLLSYMSVPEGLTNQMPVEPSGLLWVHDLDIGPSHKNRFIVISDDTGWVESQDEQFWLNTANRTLEFEENPLKFDPLIIKDMEAIFWFDKSKEEFVIVSSQSYTINGTRPFERTFITKANITGSGRDIQIVGQRSLFFELIAVETPMALQALGLDTRVTNWTTQMTLDIEGGEERGGNLYLALKDPGQHVGAEPGALIWKLSNFNSFLSDGLSPGQVTKYATVIGLGPDRGISDMRLLPDGRLLLLATARNDAIAPHSALFVVDQGLDSGTLQARKLHEWNWKMEAMEIIDDRLVIASDTGRRMPMAWTEIPIPATNSAISKVKIPESKGVQSR